MNIFAKYRVYLKALYDYEQFNESCNLETFCLQFLLKVANIPA